MYLRFLFILSGQLGQVNEIFALNLGTWYYFAYSQTVKISTKKLLRYYVYRIQPKRPPDLVIELL